MTAAEVDRVHWCSYATAARPQQRCQCECGQVWERTTVEALGRVWPSWQRVGDAAPPIPGAAERRRTTNPPGMG